jgi:DNA-binding transcriptional ArsR family regulator
MAVPELFRALGDPIRLEMVQRLSDGAPCTIGAVSAGLGITRQGARKHLQVLADAKIVFLEAHGRDVLVQLDPSGLDRAKQYISDLQLRWDRRLEALQRYLEDG